MRARKVEVLSVGCRCCLEAVAMVQQLACPWQFESPDRSTRKIHSPW